MSNGSEGGSSISNGEMWYLSIFILDVAESYTAEQFDPDNVDNVVNVNFSQFYS